MQARHPEIVSFTHSAGEPPLHPPPSHKPLAVWSAILLVAVLGALGALAVTQCTRAEPQRHAGCAPECTDRPPAEQAANLPRRGHAVDRVAVLVLENRDYRQVVGNARAPFLNRLARRYALATRYYAIGHPSLPNYLALTSGSTRGAGGNPARSALDRPNLVDQLDTAGVPWRAYFQSLPHVGYLGGRVHHLHAGAARYTRLYDPFVYFEQVTARRADRARVVPMSRLGRDLRAGALPRFTWLAPNLRHDGHNGSIATTDRYVARLVPPLLRALGHHGVLFVTWDEGPRSDRAGVGGTRGGGRVALIAAGGDVAHHVRLTTPATHYTLLATIEQAFGLRRLGHAASPFARPLLARLLESRTPAREEEDEA